MFGPLAAERVRAINSLAGRSPSKREPVATGCCRCGDSALTARGVRLFFWRLGFIFWFMYSVGGAVGSLWRPLGLSRYAAHYRPWQPALWCGSYVEDIRLDIRSGIEALLTVGIPYVFTFEFLLSLLEDSGYLNAAAYSADSAMRPLGLNGGHHPDDIRYRLQRAGNSGTRILPGKRERFIASALISLVPCSARIAVILGSVGAVSGWAAALGLE